MTEPDRSPPSLGREFSPRELAAIIRRYMHDVDNVLNAIELESTLLEESAGDPEVRAAADRMRAAVQQMEAMGRGLGAKFLAQSPARVTALDLAEQWMADVERLAGAKISRWTVDLDGAVVLVEATAMRSALVDLLAIAGRQCGRRPLAIACRKREGCAIFEVSSPEPLAMSAAPDESECALWSALGCLVARNGARLEPSDLAVRSGWFRVEIPLVPPS